MNSLLREYIRHLLIERAATPGVLKDATSTKKSERLLANKQIGYAAEWAIYNALNGSTKLFDDISGDVTSMRSVFPNDSRLTRYWNDSTDAEKYIFMGIFGKLLDKAKTTLSSRIKHLGKPKHAPSTVEGEEKVSTTEKVDVPCKNADVHVKYNDDERLLGFQEEEEKDATETATGESSQTAGLVASIYKNALRDHIADMRKSAINQKSFDTFVRPTGKIVRPKGVSARPTELANFEKVKKEYQGFLKDGKNRIAFFRKLEGNLNGDSDAKNFRAALRHEIYTKLGFDMKKGLQTKLTYFANFTGTDDMVLIADAEILSVGPRARAQGTQKAADNVIANYSVSDLKLTNWGKMLPDLSNLRIVPTGLSSKELAAIAVDYESIGMIPSEDELKANSVQQSILQPTEKEKSKANDLVSSTTKYYSIRDEEGKEYFTIEFRIDGQGQPPQLKTGPELKKKLKEKNQKA